MPAEAKRHHWWPTCHSSLWVDTDGCIGSIGRDGVIRRTKPINTAVIGHYNTVRRPDGTKDTSLEQFFATEVEGPVAPVLKRLATEKSRDFALEAEFDKPFLQSERRAIKRDGFIPDQRAHSAHLLDVERQDLARYIGSLLVRVPSYKDRLNSAHMNQSIASFFDLPLEAARFRLDSLHVEIIRQHVWEYAAKLLECAFFLCDVDGGEFVFSDTPVIPAALGFGEEEAMCPITPTRALFVARGYSMKFRDRVPIFRCRAQTARRYNRTMVQNAEREIFFRSPISASFVSKHLGTRQVRIVPTLGEAGVAPTNQHLLLDKRE